MKKNGEISMKLKKEQVISIDDFFELADEEGGTYEIETPQGWVEIGSLVNLSGRVSWELLNPALRLNTLSRFHILSPIRSRSSAL